MPEHAIYLLGPPTTQKAQKTVTLSHQKAVALLAYLATSQRSHSRDALSGFFWPEEEQSKARAELRRMIWAINKGVGQGWLESNRQTVGLAETAEIYVDVHHFETLIADSQKKSHGDGELSSASVELLETAVSLYKDDFMAGFSLAYTPPFEEWMLVQTEAFRQLLSRALKQLTTYYQAHGHYSQALTHASRYLLLDPLNESAHQTVIALYALTGQKTAALRQYDLCREQLQTELSLEPSSEITALYNDIRLGTYPPSDPTTQEFGTLVEEKEAKTAVPHNLPSNTTQFVGREKEIAQLQAYLVDNNTKLVTIVGPGGMGKTRLSLAVAHKFVTQSYFQDGVYFISLIGLNEAEVIPATIAEAIGFTFTQDGRLPIQQLSDFLREKSILIVLDNFEHILSGVDLVDTLIKQSPNLKILATSREQLNLYEEQRYPLEGLPLPKQEMPSNHNSALALFLQTIRRRQPDFKVTEEEMPHLIKICHLVEGVPLAIELAASWADMLPIPEIAAEISRGLDFLETDLRNIPTRHQSIRAVFNSSWELLNTQEQTTLAQLSVFQDGFTAEAAKAVSGASLRTLARLVNQSLLRRNQNGKRYEIHELLRQYAAEKLLNPFDNETTTRDNHAAYFCDFLNIREPALKGGHQQEAMGEIEEDSKNVNAAWHWATERLHIPQLDQAIFSLGLYYLWNGRYPEAATMFQLPIEKLSHLPSTEEDENSALLLIKLLTWQGLFNIRVANYTQAKTSLNHALTNINRPILKNKEATADRAFLLLQLSQVAVNEEVDNDTLAFAEQGLALYRTINDPWGTALAMDFLAVRHQDLGNFKTGIQLQKESLAIREQHHDHRGIVSSLNSLGNLLLFTNQLDESEQYLRQSLTLSRTFNTQTDVRGPLSILGINQLFAGNFEECISLFEESWALHRALGIVSEPGSVPVGIARSKIELGYYEEAQRLSEADLSRYRTMNHTWYVAFALMNLARIALVNADFSIAKAQLEESVHLLQERNDRPLLPDSLNFLAYTCLQLDQPQEASQHLMSAMKISLMNNPMSPLRFELPVMATLLAKKGENERAIELYATALKSPYIANSRWFEEVFGHVFTQIAQTLPVHIVEAAKQRGQDQDFWETATRLLSELESQKV